MDINLASAGEDIFVGGDLHQHLSIYDALMTAQCRGVSARVTAWPARDVIAIEIDDQCQHPDAINIELRMLRYATP